MWSVNSFLLIWPGDLVFDPMWPSFELDLEIIKTNILSKVHDDCFKSVTTRVLKFSADLARWPKFWPQVTQQKKEKKMCFFKSFIPIFLKLCFEKVLL